MGLPTYTGSMQRKPKQGNKRNKKPREEKANQQENHPKNSEKRESKSKNCWDYSRRDRKKRLLKQVSNISSSWNVLRFRSSQIHQKRQIGANLQTTLFFVPSPLTFHSRSRFLTEAGNTYTRPKEDSSKVHSSLVLSQWIRMWSADSLLSLQRLHLLTMDQPLFINMSTVKNFPQTASQVRKKKTSSKRGIQTPNLFG